MVIAQSFIKIGLIFKNAESALCAAAGTLRIQLLTRIKNLQIFIIIRPNLSIPGPHAW